jgi:hypothetical protein
MEPKPEKNQAKPKKPSQTGKNQAKQKKTKPNRFEPVFILKNRTKPKMITHTQYNKQQQHQ